jgi:hypothetical protein
MTGWCSHGWVFGKFVVPLLSLRAVCAVQPWRTELLGLIEPMNVYAVTRFKVSFAMEKVQNKP